MAGKITIGTSSWADPGFVEEWYPPGLPAPERLPYYAEHFDGVEVNSTFYGMPEQSVVERWARATPDHFTFDVKLHRLLSRHAAGPEALPKDLRETAETTSRGRVVLTPQLQDALAAQVLEATLPLAESGRLSSFLLQLSPSFTPERHALDELEPLITALQPHPVAVEFRHFTWLDKDARDQTIQWLADHRAPLVGVDAPQGRAPTLIPQVDVATNPELAYLRAHGRDYMHWTRGKSVAERFAYQYSDAELEEIGDRAKKLSSMTQDVRLQFNNNRGADAPQAATRMRQLLGQESGVGA